MIPEFREFPKIARLSREIVVTEKIDGTNGLVYISENGEIQAGSRTKWITVHDDNAGFANWVEAHKSDLLSLGHGYHYGEWWGQKIQRSYGQSEKHFSLFNTSRWQDPLARPVCCSCVPILYQGMFSEQAILDCLESLKENGSAAAPGFKPAEGVVVFHIAANMYFKKTIERDEKPKGSKEIG